MNKKILDPFSILAPTKKKLDENPELLEEYNDFAKKLKMVLLETPETFSAYEGLYDVLGVPLKFENFDMSYGAYMAKHKIKDGEDVFEDTQISLSLAFVEIFKNPDYIDLKSSVKNDITWTYVHELMHGRFSHLFKEKHLMKQYKMPSSVYNIAFDIFINTLIKYSPFFANKIGSMNIPKFVCRYISTDAEMEELKDILIKNASEYGVSLTEKEIKVLNVMRDKNIEEMTDNELVETFYQLFKDFFDKHDEIMQKTLDKLKDEITGGNSNSPMSFEQTMELMSRAEKEIKEEVKKEAASNKDFAKNLKKYLSNFNALPSPQMEIQMQSGGMHDNEMSPRVRVEAAKARAEAQKIVNSIEANQSKGNIPGWLRSFADMQPIKPDYFALLKGFSKKFLGDGKRTFSPPNKKHALGEIVMPSKIDYQKDILFIIDTSGSMGDSDIEIVIKHMAGILKASSSDSVLHIIFNDAQLQYIKFKGKQTSKLFDIIKNGVQGGGGSVFNEAFRHPSIKKVDAVVFLSDFYIYLDDITINKPTILLHTKHHDATQLERIRKNCRPSITIPIEK